jgi:multiple sugar transport system ATP-binding protein
MKKKFKSVKMGIRPEHIGIAEVAAPSTVSAVVASCESTGNMTYINCIFAGSNLNITVPYRQIVNTGNKINLTIDLQNIHLFDAESGKRISDD